MENIQGILNKNGQYMIHLKIVRIFIKDTF